MTSESRGLIFRERAPFLALTAVVLLLDRWSKIYVQRALSFDDVNPIINGFFDLVYFRNTGIAFGFLDGPDSRFRLVVLSVFAVIAAIVVIVYSIRSPASNTLLQTSLALILGGALGNLYDRLTIGFVTDFLYFHLGSYDWPAFNVADTAISTGVGLMAIDIIRHELRNRH